MEKFLSRQWGELVDIQVHDVFIVIHGALINNRIKFIFNKA